jgi:phosphate-selective porin OprO/OprP
MQVDVTGESKTDFSPSDYVRDFFVGITGLGPLGRLEAGIVKEPISLGVLTSGLNLEFMERGLPTIMAPSLNAGFVFRNELLDQNLSWAFGVFRGQGDSGDTSAVDIVGRVSGVPWRDEEKGRMLHLGVAYKLEVGEFDQRYASRPETDWGDQWIGTGEIPSDGSHLLGIELAGVWKPISFQAELLSSWVSQSAGPTLNFWGAYGQLSYFLTGEQRHYLETRRVFGRVRLNQDFSLRNRTWGAFELAARYSYLDLDDGAIRGGRLSDITFGVNWYFQSNLRVMFNYTRARLNGADNGNIVGTRFQIDY